MVKLLSNAYHEPWNHNPLRAVEMPIKKYWFWSVTSCSWRYMVSWHDMI
jgi:hypothetical protein